MFKCLGFPCDLTFGSSCIQRKQRKYYQTERCLCTHRSNYQAEIRSCVSTTLLNLLLFKLRPGNVRAMRAQASFTNRTTVQKFFQSDQNQSSCLDFILFSVVNCCKLTRWGYFGSNFLALSFFVKSSKWNKSSITNTCISTIAKQTRKAPTLDKSSALSGR